MKSTEPVALEEILESLDDRDLALRSASPSESWLAQNENIPDLAVPVALGYRKFNCRQFVLCIECGSLS